MSINYNGASATDGLVFAYDLDNSRSYKGEPATNIWTSGDPSGHGSTLEVINTNSFLGKKIDSGVVYRNKVSNPAQSNTNTYYNNGGINKGSMGFTNINPTTKYIQISFDYYGVTPFVRHSSASTGLRGYLGVTSTDNTNDVYGWDTTYSPGNGDDWNNDANRMGYWQKISLIVALRGDKTPDSIFAMYIYLDAATQGEGYFTNMIFTEHVTYPTGPIAYTSGTRSSTQGLLDLAGNSTIDLANVSFNSNSQVEFDGTDDVLSIDGAGDLNFGVTRSFSIETIFKINNIPLSGNTSAIVCKGHCVGIDFYFPPEGIRLRTGIRNGIDGQQSPMSNQVIDTEKYYHAVYTYTPNQAGGIKLYINGVIDKEANNLGYSEFADPTKNFEIGGNVALGGNNVYSDITVPIVKMYNKPLTAQEVTQNFNSLKNRFNL